MLVAASRTEGFTLLELIFITAVIGLLSAIAIPTVFRSRLAANETSVIGTMHGIHTAQLTYSLTCGFGNFAESFPTLGGMSGDEFLPPEMTAGVHATEERIQLHDGGGASGPSIFTDCNGAAMATEYYVSAEPLVDRRDRLPRVCQQPGAHHLAGHDWPRARRALRGRRNRDADRVAAPHQLEARPHSPAVYNAEARGPERPRISS